ncbi:Neuroguidin [Glycine soja]
MENTAGHNDDSKQNSIHSASLPIYWVCREAPKLAALLKEMKEGLDTVRRKIQSLTATVKEGQYPTADGFSYLEAKNLLLLNYCQSLVYYLLRKAKGLSIEDHPVVRSVVEIRLFLEKIRPIDKKQQYQIQKLIQASENATRSDIQNKEPVASNKSEDVSKYRPNPDMLVSKVDLTLQDGNEYYQPVKFAPTSMDLERSSKYERNALRREKEILKQAKQSDYIRTLMNDMEEKPEEIRDFEGASREVDRYIAKMDERARQEEELFTRVPLTKQERKREKYLKKSRNGLQGLTESFYDEIKTLPFGDKTGEQVIGSSNGGRTNNRLKKRKACTFYTLKLL